MDGKRIFKKSHQLITIDNEQKIFHYEKCKIIVNKIANCVIFEPHEAKILSTTFDKTFFQYKNFICIFDLDTNGYNFVLILSNEKKAKAILDIVHKGKAYNTTFASHQYFLKKFLIPVCSVIHGDIFLQSELQKLLIKIYNLFDVEQKQVFFDLCNNANIDSSLFEEHVNKKVSNSRKSGNNQHKSDESFNPDSMNSSSDSYKSDGLDCAEPPSKKPKTSNNSNVTMKRNVKYKRKPTSYRLMDNVYTADQIVRKPNYKLVTSDDLHNPRQRLIIFSLSNKDLCHEYFLSKFSKLFYCCGCYGQKHTTAYVKTINGEECIKMNSINHICELRQYLPEKYSFDPKKQIIEAPNFEVYSYQRRKETKKRLIIFDSNAGKKKICYEYYWENRHNAYFCCGCRMKQQNVKAIICKNLKDEKDYVKLSKQKHVCEMREYKPEKHKSDIIYQKPDYQIIEHTKYGTAAKKLFIFTSPERTHCYNFTFNDQPTKQNYTCTKCQQKNRHIIANVCVDENGEEFLSVQNKQHVCEPVEYQPEKYSNNEIIKKPNYQFAKKQSRKKIISKLIIFLPNDKNYCYELSWQDHYKAYQCTVCSHKYKNFVIARVINLGNEEEEHVELSKHEHKCQPVKYEPRYFEIKIVEAPNFEIKTSFKKGKKVEHLYVYPSENKQLSYKYYYISARKCWCCCGCVNLNHKKKISITAKIVKNENGEDCVQLGPRDHICKPQKF